MQSALDQFRISIARVRELISLHNSVKAQSTTALDLSDILRAALVLAVSALDYYVHEVVTLGMLEIHRGQRSEPNPPRNSSQSAFSRFQVSLGGARQERLIAMDIASWLENEIQQSQGSSFLQQSHTVSALLPVISNSVLNRLNNASWLEDEVRERLSYQSFQQPEKIADAMRLISDNKLWEEVAQKLGRSAKDVKQQLSAIVDRRNKIAHEADIDPTYNIGSRWYIDEVLVSDAVNFVEQVVETIHQIL
ncbi:MAG: HEPN domain-containing protein [Coleofasciculus chthonoplastes F3-SA18-01]|uniref:HEPN domain-containing protein n=1 Tax=Coleofasciculus chthonoplastes TaxID=64178 RepID=UPI0032F7C018